MRPLIVFTVGHSTRTIDAFQHLLKAHGTIRSSARPYALRPWARVNGTHVTYPAAAFDLEDKDSGWRCPSKTTV